MSRAAAGAVERYGSACDVLDLDRRARWEADLAEDLEPGAALLLPVIVCLGRLAAARDTL